MSTTPPPAHATHTVFNQPPPFEDVNLFTPFFERRAVRVGADARTVVIALWRRLWETTNVGSGEAHIFIKNPD